MTDFLLIVVVAIVVFLLLKNLFFSKVSTVDVVKEIDTAGKTKEEYDEPTVIQDYTPKMLSNYNGFDLEKIFMAVNGKVYDVSSGRRFYGPSGPYSNFAGHDASRGLAKNSFELEVIPTWDQPIDDLSDLTENEWSTLRNWENMFKGKYPVVGNLVSEADYSKNPQKSHSSSSVMAHIATDNLTANNLGQLSKISSPEIYSEKFIKECKELGELAQYVYFDEVPVGFVVSNVFQPQNSSVPIGLIISVLKVLPAYAHKYGLENALISYVEKMTTEKRLLHRIFLLADRNNDQWLIAYARKHGFGEDTKTPVHIDSKHQLDSKGKLLLVKHL